MMRKILHILALAAVCLGTLSVFRAAAQQVPIRYSYLSNGFVHISTERERVEAELPFEVRLEKIIFPDGKSVSYKMELDFISKTSVSIPKSVKLSARTASGKIVGASQVYQSDGRSRPAFDDGSGHTLYWNRAQYVFEEADMKLLAAGVSVMEVAYEWSPDGFWQFNFKKNEFGSVLKRHLSALTMTPPPLTEIGDRIADYANRTGSITIFAKAEKFDEATAQLRYIYYKNTNQEDFDLTLRLSTGRSDVLAFESPVVFHFADGSQMSLPQQQEANNLIILYPNADELRSLFKKPMRSVTYQTVEGATYTVSLPGFKEALAAQYNALMMVAPI